MGSRGDSGAKLVSAWSFYCSGTGLGSILGSIWDPKRNKFGYIFCAYFVMCFLSLWERFGIDFGAILVSKEPPKSEIVKYEE